MTTRRAGTAATALALSLSLLLVGFMPAAGADTMERGRSTWERDATDTVFCGILLTRHVEGQVSWIERRDDAGELTYSQGALKVTVDLFNAENGRSIRLRGAGLDRSFFVSEADETLTIRAAGTGLWGTLPGQGKVSGVAGLATTIMIEGEEVHYDVRGTDSGLEAMCAYLAGA